MGRFQATDDPLGWESTVAIGVESTRARQNFLVLKQDGVRKPLVRGPGGETRQVGLSPLGRLLQDAVLGPAGGVRSQKEAVGKFVVRVVSWRTDPAKTLP